MDFSRSVVMVTDMLAAIRINGVPEGMLPEAINGNVAIFSDGSGRERPYVLPIGEGERCTVRRVRLAPDTHSGVIEFGEIIPDPCGAYRANLSITPGDGGYWVVIVVEPVT